MSLWFMTSTRAEIPGKDFCWFLTDMFVFWLIHPVHSISSKATLKNSFPLSFPTEDLRGGSRCSPTPYPAISKIYASICWILLYSKYPGSWKFERNTTAFLHAEEKQCKAIGRMRFLFWIESFEFFCHVVPWFCKGGYGKAFSNINCLNKLKDNASLSSDYLNFSEMHEVNIV